MSLDVYLDPHIVTGSQVLDAGHLVALQSQLGTPRNRIDFTFDAAGGVEAARAALQRVRQDISAAFTIGASDKPAVIVLSDRGATEQRAVLPALLALSAAWKEMVRVGAHDVPLIVESGQVIETHHIALLIAVGASAVFPYLAMELAENLKPGGAVSYRVAVEAGLRKVLARMGISTVASYRNSHLFETVGLDDEVRAAFFEDSAAALGGKTLKSILEDALLRHSTAFKPNSPEMQDAGFYRFRQTGERHSNSPELVRRMHRYIKAPTPEAYRSFAELAQTRETVSVRDLLEIASGSPIALAEVEPAASILSRFSSQAMSLGALGPEAHRTLAIAMN